jgi:glycosyltransferase involved in cell wall biosynthesis
MCDISIIIGFKDREIQRVIKCLNSLKKQTFKNFEVIFVDYGSHPNTSLKLTNHLKKYPFVHYILNDTRGMYWNRSHALNSGIQVSKGEYIYLSDIDIVYDSEFLNHLNETSIPEAVIFSQVYLLPENFDVHSIVEHQIFPLTTKSARGNFFIKKDKFIEIGGFDEFYSIWGIEDNDFFQRCLEVGLSEKWSKHEEYPTFHMWHPEVSNETKGLMPEKWLDDMVLHYLTNLTVAKRNIPGYGKIFNEENRPALKVALNRSRPSRKIIIPSKGYSSAKTLAFRNIYFEVSKLEKGETCEITVPKINELNISRTHSLLLKIISKILLTFRSPYRLTNELSLERDKLFFPEPDIRYFIWKLIKTSDVINDYYIKEYNDSTTYYLTK